MAKDHTIGSAPIEPAYIETMNSLAKVLDLAFNRGKLPMRDTGFVLLVFPFGQGEDHRCNYISNAERRDVVTMLREQLSYFEGMPETPTRRA